MEEDPREVIRRRFPHFTCTVNYNNSDSIWKPILEAKQEDCSDPWATTDEGCIMTQVMAVTASGSALHAYSRYNKGEIVVLSNTQRCTTVECSWSRDVEDGYDIASKEELAFIAKHMAGLDLRPHLSLIKNAGAAAPAQGDGGD